MRLILAALFLILFARSGIAQEIKPAIADATARFTKAERDLTNLPREQYDAARENLAIQALAVVATDPSSKAAEDLLHWILSYPSNSPSGKSAVQYLVKHHVTSKGSVQRLLSYAQHPTGWQCCRN